MNLPFERQREKWEPRKRIGEGVKLTRVEKEILEVVDILEQKTDRTERLGVRAYNLSLLNMVLILLLIATLIVKFPGLLKTLMGFF